MASHVLASICNQASDPRPSCLLRLDLETQHAEWVDVGATEPLVSGAGICAHDGFIYHVSIVEAGFDTILTILDRDTLEVLRVCPLPEVTDAHSLQHDGAELFVASTGTDEVVAYRLDGCHLGDARVVWTPTGSGEDTHHINSLVLADGELLCSAFGARVGESWTQARDGYLFNVMKGTRVLGGLRQPHSATWHDGELYFCNSQEGTVNTTEAVVTQLAGYTRGLAFDSEGTMFAGTSLARRPSQPVDDTAVFLNPNDQGALHGQCAIVRMSGSGGYRMEIGMSSYGAEIYDLLPLP